MYIYIYIDTHTQSHIHTYTAQRAFYVPNGKGNGDSCKSVTRSRYFHEWKSHAKGKYSKAPRTNPPWQSNPLRALLSPLVLRSPRAFKGGRLGSWGAEEQGLRACDTPGNRSWAGKKRVGLGNKLRENWKLGKPCGINYATWQHQSAVYVMALTLQKIKKREKKKLKTTPTRSARTGVRPWTRPKVAQRTTDNADSSYFFLSNLFWNIPGYSWFGWLMPGCDSPVRFCGPPEKLNFNWAIYYKLRMCKLIFSWCISRDFIDVTS